MPLTRNQKRGLKERKRKKKFSYFKNTGQLLNYYRQKREPVKVVEKAEAEITKEIIMKSIFKSKIFWLAVIPIIVGVLNYIEGALAAGSVLTIYGILMVIMRLLTSEKVYITKPKE